MLCRVQDFYQLSEALTKDPTIFLWEGNDSQPPQSASPTSNRPSPTSSFCHGDWIIQEVSTYDTVLVRIFLPTMP